MSSFSAARRRALVGLGAAGATLAIFAGSKTLLARQFVSDSVPVRLPEMVYDPELQMMVDPVTREPTYGDMKNITVASGLPTVTAGCADCPKKDDEGE